MLAMKMPSLEDIASRWTVGHTVAAFAWVVALALGIANVLQSPRANYPTAKSHKIYAGENATFTYPDNWVISSCVPGEPLISLPGTIMGTYRGKDAYPLSMYGISAFSCVKGRPVRLDIHDETIVASENPCSIRNSTSGERLKNGLYLQLQQDGENILAVNIRQNKCFTQTDTSVLGFSFATPTANKDDGDDPATPRVKKDVFLASQQYRDIRAVAESIRY
jgi:hypothetical protein